MSACFDFVISAVWSYNFSDSIFFSGIKINSKYEINLNFHKNFPDLLSCFNHI